MTGCPAADHLRQLLGREDTLVEDADLVAHLDECASCRLRLEEMGCGKVALITAAGSLESSSYEAEPPLRRVLDELRGDDATIVGRPVDRTSWVQRLLRPVESLDGLGEIGGYEVTEILGQGSMGLVLKARDPALKRWVALKVLAPDLAGDGVARQRFAREAQAAAAIHHPNVTTIFHVSEDNGLPYFVMEYVRGGSLQDYLDNHGPSDWRTVAELGAEVAEGLAAAHAKGLVHRDIKPSNILLSEERAPKEENGDADTADDSSLKSRDSLLSTRVKIGDFGLARVADESRLTQTGIVAGTPMYMSPEQAEGKPLDTRADLFSLGSVLYTLCTGREPFLAASPLAVLRQVCEGTPKSIHDLNPEIPDWLVECIDRLHAKLPEDRFANATEVAELLRYNLDHPDAPRRAPPSPRKRAHRFRPLRMSLIATGVMLVLLLGGLALNRSWHKSHATTDSSNPLPVLITIDAHEGPVPSIAFSPDGQILATGGDDRHLRLWDPATGQLKSELPIHQSPVISIAFAHSGKFLVSPDGDGTIHIWSFENGKERLLSPKPGNPLRRVALSADDRTLVGVLSNSQSVVAVDMDSGEVRYSVSASSSSIWSVAFAPHREMLATGTSGRIQFWDANSGKEAGQEISDPPLRVTQLAFTPDGEALASSRIGDKEIKLWSVENSDLIRSFSGGEDVVSMGISKDGRLLAAGSSDGTVRIWAVSNGDLLVTLHAHQGRVQIAFSPDSRKLATAGDDHLVKLWDLESLNP
jgi:serine/threonine protein kinase